MKAVLIVNPHASSVSAVTRRRVEEVLRRELDTTVVETTSRGHAIRLAREAARRGAKAVVVLGGDGTLNEAANGLARTATPLAALPGGSTNVLARTIGAARDPAVAAQQVVESLAVEAIDTIGLGKVNDRYFLVNVGMGFDAAVVALVERRSWLKRYAAHPLFVYSAFATWLWHVDRRRPAFRVETEGSAASEAFFALALNSNPYTFLGPWPLDVAPDAMFDRGLAVVTIDALRFGPTLALAAGALGIGRAVRDQPQVRYHSDLGKAIADGHRPFPYQVDGDYLGETDRLVLTHEPGALRLVVPPVSSEAPRGPTGRSGSRR